MAQLASKCNFLQRVESAAPSGCASSPKRILLFTSILALLIYVGTWIWAFYFPSSLSLLSVTATPLWYGFIPWPPVTWFDYISVIALFYGVAGIIIGLILHK
jgi:hypothetical protein